MSGSFKDRRLVVAYSDIFKRQPAWGTPLANSDLNRAHPLTARSVFERRITREDILDCGGEYLLGREKTSELYLYNLVFDATPQLLFGWHTLARGVAAAPTGTPADEVQTLTNTATGGTYRLTFTFEGLTAQTDLLAFNAAPSVVQTALENLRSIGTGNILAAGTASSMTFTFVGKLAKANLPLMTVDNTALTGGTASIAATTNGAQRLHLGSRGTSDQPPVTTVAIGFEGDTTPPDKYSDVVVNSISVTGAIRGKVTANVQIIAAKETAAPGLSLPPCSNERPLYTKNCRVQIDGNYYNDTLREFSDSYSNNIFTGDNAFPFDSIFASRLERGDRRVEKTFSVYGSKGDAPYTLGATESVKEVRMQLGPPGDRCEIVTPKTLLTLADNPITFAGEASKSAIQLQGVPLYDGATAGTPDTVNGYLSQSTAFLST